MKVFISFAICLCLFLTGCVVGSNIAWRGQTDTYKYDFKATTEGKIENAPTATKGDSRIDAQKEYSDSFKTDANVAAGDNAQAAQKPEEKKEPLPTVE